MRIDPVAETFGKLERLLALAEELKRTNLEKLTFSTDDWNAAVAAFDPPHYHGEEPPKDVRETLHSARNIARRLGDSGVARLASFKVGRAPDSSVSGQRFHADLAKASSIHTKLRMMYDSRR